MEEFFGEWMDGDEIVGEEGGIGEILERKGDI